MRKMPAVSQTLKDLLYQKVHRIVFTSATLSTNKNFDYLRSRIGLSDDVLMGIYPSHFDFKNQIQHGSVGAGP